jgi:hypothetical protein
VSDLGLKMTKSIVLRTKKTRRVRAAVRDPIFALIKKHDDLYRKHGGGTAVDLAYTAVIKGRPTTLKGFEALLDWYARHTDGPGAPIIGAGGPNDSRPYLCSQRKAHPRGVPVRLDDGSLTLSRASQEVRHSFGWGPINGDSSA